MLRGRIKRFILMVGSVRSSLVGRMMRGAFWTGVGTLAARGATVIASFCVARFCGKAEFGEYGMVINTASMLSTVCGMGMGHSVIKYVAEFRERDPERASRILALSTFVTWVAGALFGIGFFLLAGSIATNVIAAPQTTLLLRIASIGVLLGVFNEVQLASLTGCEAFKERACINVISGMLQALFLIAGSWFWGLIGAVVAYSISYVWMVGLTTWYMCPVWKKYGLHRVYRGMFAEWRVLLNFSLPAMLLLLLGMPVSWLTRVLLARIPDGYNHLAIVNAVAPWRGLIIFAITTVCSALIPVLSDVIGGGDTKRALRIVWKVFRYNSFAVIPFCLVVSLMAPVILSFYGNGFESGRMTFVIMVFAAGIGTIYQPMWNYLVGAGMMWTNFTVVFLTAILQVVIAYVLVCYGSLGLACSELAVTIIRLIVLTVLFACLTKRCNSLYSNLKRV